MDKIEENSEHYREYEYIKDKEIFYIQMTETPSNLNITIKRDIIIPRKKYEANFTLEELIAKSKWFRIFDSTQEAFNEMHLNLIENQYRLIETTNSIDFLFKIPLKTKDEIILSLIESSPQLEDIIPDLQLSINQISKILCSLNTKFEILENNEFKKLYQKEELRSSDQCLLQKDEENLIKAKLSTSDNKTIDFVFIYKATIDGDKSDNFHSCCDYQGPTVIILKTTRGFVFGGYTSESWDKSGEFKCDNDSFLFSMNFQRIYPINANTKAIYCLTTYGPTFGGGHDICILNNCLHTSKNYCYFNGTFEGANFEINGNDQYFTVQELEVYKVIIK